ncbi:alpha/beta hydrolase [uncultured Leifsonia sp.]|uniref:alpha/beta fold hydrolase n=1 Tax=uncultured Leifsonia sp. TaxID=340359 RepID=UPI0028D46A13|nr:alpha/beta hydrolase [uncultured Leifsonia sp.]
MAGLTPAGASSPGSLALPDGRALRFFDTGGADDAPVLVWHHGTPQTGAVIAPIAEAAARRGVRVVSAARPGYPGSDPLPGRTVADAAADVIALLDALGVDRFVTAGASGGGPHALACADLAPRRTAAVVTLAGIAPFWGSPDWFAGMTDPGGLQAALAGPDARAAHAESAEFDPDSFTQRDYQTWRDRGARSARMPERAPPRDPAARSTTTSRT